MRFVAIARKSFSFSVTKAIIFQVHMVQFYFLSPTGERTMAKNFKILFSEKSNRLIQIQLQGDFDGTSAHELINTLRKYLAIYPKVAIDTEGLKRINTFGLDVLSTRLKSLRRSHARIAFSGRYRSIFITE